MRVVSVDALIRQARSWTDIGMSQSPTDAEILDFANQSIPEWFEKLLDASESDWAFAQYQFITQNGVSSYNLPADANRLRFVDSLVTNNGSGAQRWVGLRRYDEALRNSYGAIWGPQGVPGGQTVRLSYNPVAPVFAQYASLQILTADGLDSITITAKQPGPNGKAITVAIALGGSLGVAVTGLAITITVPSSGSAPTATAVLQAFNAVAAATYLASISTTQGNDTLPQVAMAATPLAGTVAYDFVNGWDRYVVADMSAYICRRLGREATPFEAEKQRLEAGLLTRAAKRDSGEPQVCKDVQRQNWIEGPGSMTIWPYRFAYRIFGQNPASPGPGTINLLPLVI